MVNDCQLLNSTARLLLVLCVLLSVLAALYSLNNTAHSSTMQYADEQPRPHEDTLQAERAAVEVQPSPSTCPSGPEGRIRARVPGATVSFSMSVVNTRGVREALVHLLKGANYAFDDVFIVIDQGKNELPNEMVHELEQLIKEGLIKRYVKTDYSDEAVEKVYGDILGKDFRQRHNYSADRVLPRKSPYAKGHVSYMLEMEECRTDYCVHFDSDMSMYSPRNFSWVHKCITRMQELNANREQFKSDNLVKNRKGQIIDPRHYYGFCHPVWGPRWGYDGEPKDWYFYYWYKEQNVVVHDVYTSRFNLFQRKAYEMMKPMAYLESHWEQTVTHNMRLRHINRFDLLEGAWAIHTKNSQHLVNVRRCVEKGVFPIGTEGEIEAGRIDTKGDWQFGHWPICPPEDAM